MRDQTWAQIRKLVREGKAPSIEVKVAEKVVTPPRKRGRPRVRGVNGEVFHYKMHTSNGQPMRCRWFGCDNTLKRDQASITCCQTCENSLREYAQACLDVISGKIPAEDFPMAFRTRHTRKKTKK